MDTKTNNPLELQVSPFSADDCQFGFQLRKALALVVVNEASTPPVLDTQCLAELYLLTPKEVLVARYLAQGMSLDKIAAATYTSLSTVRTHLKALFRKTDTNSQPQLVSRLLSSLAAYTPQNHE